MPQEGDRKVNKITGQRAVFRGGDWVLVDAPKLTQDQGQAQGYARGMADAEARYYDAVRNGYNPADFRNTAAAIAEGLPFGGLDGLGAVIRDDVSDVGRQAELQWSDAQLREQSGAAAPEPEVKRNVRTYFPRPGESPFVIGPQKREARMTAFEAARRRSGPAAAEIKPRPPQALAGRGGPRAGTVENGYRFKGGDPGNPKNWIKVQ